jgi:hypothetical protein
VDLGLDAFTLILIRLYFFKYSSMKKRTTLHVLLLCTMANAYAQLSPEVTSWLVNANSATWHDILETNVEQVQYTDTDVYISCEAIPGYDVGPWDDPSMPPNQNFVFKITRNPQPALQDNLLLPKGHIGVWSNGASIFEPSSGDSFQNNNVWHVNAGKNISPNTIKCDGMAAENGEFYNYIAPICIYDVSEVKVHSPILGYAFDGYPIYGAYAYTNADGSGGISRMESSYQIRQIIDRNTLPDGTILSENLWGPKISNNYPLGHYKEDYSYVAGSGNLDMHNGRFCITPEYPAGTYAYFATVNEENNPAYPYTIGHSYYGIVQSGNIGTFSGHNEIAETAITYVSSGKSANEIDMLVYPNPAQDYVYIYVAPSYNNNITATVTDMAGKVISKQNNLQPGITYEINVSMAMDGLYFVKLENETSLGIQKFIINRR